MRLPRRLHVWLRSMRTTRAQLISQLLGPVELLKYLPHRSSAASFVVTKRRGEAEGRLPVPSRALWEGYGESAAEYLASGEEDVRTMLGLLEAVDRPLRAGERVLDFGCAAGRMLRWLAHWTEQGEVWGADISARHILWCRQHLTPPFHFLTSTTLPHLPFADGYFDFIYAGSVFTHIDDLADAWLLELRRVIRPGGRLFVTIHDRTTIEVLARAPDEWLAAALRSNRSYRRYVRSDFAMFTIGRGSTSQVFYDAGYFCRMLEPGFIVLSMVPEAYGYQTGILAEKRS